MQRIETDQAPAAVGHYEQGYVSGNHIYTSMQIPLLPEGGDNALRLSLQEQSLQVLKNAAAIVKSGGAALTDIVQVRIYLTDMERFKVVDEVYKSFFGAHKPARAVVGVASLPKGYAIAVEMIAELPE